MLFVLSLTYQIKKTMIKSDRIKRNTAIRALYEEKQGEPYIKGKHQKGSDEVVRLISSKYKMTDQSIYLILKGLVS